MEPGCQKLSLEQTGAFSDLFLDYITEKDSLKPFYSQYPKIENFKKLIEEKSFSDSKRKVLVSELEKQYEYISYAPDFDLLRDSKTFTVTTGHQLNIFTGPLYIVFKIVTIINLAKSLKAAYPEYNFIPVYWMASEDHDLEEIQYMNAFGKKYWWETNQTGAVGPMATSGLSEIAAQLGKAAEVFQKAYSENRTLANAVRAYMHSLFGQYGLITIDANTRSFKAEFKEIIKDDLLKNTSFDLVTKRTDNLESLGYKTQISPREINFFYLSEGKRERIIQEGEQYQVLNTDLSFSKSEILELVEQQPELFSPNVVLRPLYEEVILPNLAYIGGPSEVPYWLQLKPIFDFYQVAFPALMPRNFGALINKNISDDCFKLSVRLEDLFKPSHTLQNGYAHKQSELDLDLTRQIEEMKTLFSQIRSKTDGIDKTLSRTTSAFETKTIDLIEKLEKKILRAEKRKHSEGIAKLEKLKENLFPGGGLQERKENIIPFLEQRPDLIELLINTFDPLDYRFNLIEI